MGCIRRKKNKDSLRSADDKIPLPERQLTDFLGGLDKTQFEQLFGLDSSRLVEGGQAIADGQGELGEALFSAGAGMKGLLPYPGDWKAGNWICSSQAARTNRSERLSSGTASYSMKFAVRYYRSRNTPLRRPTLGQLIKRRRDLHNERKKTHSAGGTEALPGGVARD